MRRGSTRSSGWDCDWAFGRLDGSTTSSASALSNGGGIGTSDSADGIVSNAFVAATRARVPLSNGMRNIPSQRSGFENSAGGRTLWGDEGGDEVDSGMARGAGRT